MSMSLKSLRAYDAAGARIDVGHLTAVRVRRTVFRILKTTPLCAMATVSVDASAHVNTAYFAYSAALELYVLSHPGSLHCRNIRARPEIAIAVFESNQRWGELDRGLQLFGTCREARGTAARRAERAYGTRFKPYAEWMAESDDDEAAPGYRFYRFVTRRLKVFDEREFGGGVFVGAAVG